MYPDEKDFSYNNYLINILNRYVNHSHFYFIVIVVVYDNLQTCDKVLSNLIINLMIDNHTSCFLSISFLGILNKFAGWNMIMRVKLGNDIGIRRDGCKGFRFYNEVTLYYILYIYLNELSSIEWKIEWWYYRHIIKKSIFSIFANRR